MVAVGGQFQNRKKRGELFIASLRRGKPHVVIDRPPRQQPRLLKHHAYPCACRTGDAALIVVVEAAAPVRQAHGDAWWFMTSEQHTSELQSPPHLVYPLRLLDSR